MEKLKAKTKQHRTFFLIKLQNNLSETNSNNFSKVHAYKFYITVFAFKYQ